MLECPSYVRQLTDGEVNPITSFGCVVGYSFPPNIAFTRKWETNRAGAIRHGFQLNTDGDLVSWIPPNTDEDDRLTLSSVMEPEDPDAIIRPYDKSIIPRPYQLAGAERIVERNTLLADEQGLGKTLTILMAVATMQDDASLPGFRALVVCPANLRLWWQREAERVLGPQWHMVCSVGTKEQTEVEDRDEPSLYICGSSTIAQQRNLIEESWDVLVVDEAHQFKDPNAKRTMAVMGLIPDKNTWHDRVDFDANQSRIGGIDAQRRVFATGTPIPKSPIDIYPMLVSLWGDSDFGNYNHFGKTFCGAFQMRAPWNNRMQWHYRPKWTKMTNKKKEKLKQNMRNLRILLLRKGMVRRKKEQAIAELPPKTYQVIPMHPTDALLKSMQAEEEAWFGIEDVRKARQRVLTAENDKDREMALDNLESVCFEHMEEMSELRMDVGLHKVGALLSTIHDWLDSREDSLVLFAHHRCVVDALYEGVKKYGAVKFYGKMKPEEKDDAVAKFQNGDVRVFVGNIVAAGVGITLHRASHAIFIESDWTPGLMGQAADRIHRIGQTQPCLIQNYVLDGSIDALIAESAAHKSRIIDLGVDGLEFGGQQSRSNHEKEQSTYLRGDLMEQKRKVLQEAIKSIHARCDGAMSLDGEGWSATDRDFGSSLASWDGDFTDKQCEAAIRLVHKYRKQVSRGHLEALFGITERDAKSEGELELFEYDEVLKTQRNVLIDRVLEGEISQSKFEEQLFELDNRIDNNLKTV